MAFEALAEAAERWCARTPFQLIAAEETERRMDFYAEPGVSFYVLCPEAACGDNFHVWSESEDCLPFLQLAQDYISSCGKRHSMKYWKKSSNPSDLYSGFQMSMMMRSKNIMQIWKKRNQKRITNKWVSVSSNFQRS